MRFFLCCFLLGIFSQGYSQKSPVRYGDISMEDMKMTSYNRDSSAEAVVLVDYGEAYVQERADDDEMFFTRHVRIKVLSKEGLSWANGSIPLYHAGDRTEKVSGFKASAYNLENGKIVETKLTKENVFKVKENKNYDRQKFTVPGVKEGSIIEYTYTIMSGFIWIFPNWSFQKEIPVRWSEYWAIIPDVFIYEKYMQGYIVPTSYNVKETPGSKAHHWIYQYVPAFKTEAFMNCETDYITKINFELSGIDVPGKPYRRIMGSWSTLSKILRDDEDFGKVITQANFLQSKVNELTKGVTDPEQKMKIIHAYIKDNIEWDGTNDYTAGNLKKIIETKKGTSGDINLILASMLDKAGLEPEMLMISTQDHGVVRRAFPLSKQFNYVLCVVTINGKDVLLDATERHLPMTILPERCLNGEGLIISSKREGWINVVPPRSRTAVSGSFDLSENGDLKGKLVYQRASYDAFAMRKKYLDKGEAEYMKDLVKEKSWTVEKSAFSGVSELDQPVKENHEISIQEHATITGDVIYIDPMITLKEPSNPFLPEKRVYPIDYGHPIERIYMISITIPPVGFTVDEFPAVQLIALPGNTAKFSYNIGVNGSVINITSNLQINKSQFIQSEYPALREFYSRFIAKQNEQIVLKRKK